jgi:glyoxylase-like metal-dependent hydrolase (beta-lactamase superfamily II)
MSVLITEVVEGIYEITPEGKSIKQFPLCTVYLVVDDKPALIEAGLPVQASDITRAVEKLMNDISRVAYVFLTHAHSDHAGGIGILAQRFPQARVVAHPEAARLITDESLFTKSKQGFKMVFGEDAEERFGTLSPGPEDRFEFIHDGESIRLGKRDLRAVHTPGHDPYHLCFLDTISGALFCGDALGCYFPEIDIIAAPHTPGTDFTEALHSIEKLREFNPALLLFSHGCAIKEGGKYLQMAASNLRNCQNAALEGLRAEEPRENIANKILDIWAEDSESARAELSGLWGMTLSNVDAYRYFFKKKNII